MFALLGKFLKSKVGRKIYVDEKNFNYNSDGLFFFFSGICAQDDYYEQEQRRMEAEQREKVAFESVQKLANKEFIDLNFFLPESKNSRFISVTSKDGFTGGTRLLAAVNSDGNYLCSTHRNFTKQTIAKDIIDSLFQTINGFDFDKFATGNVKKIEFCSDCAYTTLTFRNAEKTYRFDRAGFANADSEIKAIYDKVVYSSGCQKYFAEINLC